MPARVPIKTLFDSFSDENFVGFSVKDFDSDADSGAFAERVGVGFFLVLFGLRR